MSHIPQTDQIAFSIEPGPWRPFLTADATGGYRADATMVVYELGRLIGTRRAAEMHAAAKRLIDDMADDSVMSAKVTIDAFVDLVATRIVVQQAASA